MLKVKTDVLDQDLSLEGIVLEEKNSPLLNSIENIKKYVDLLIKDETGENNKAIEEYLIVNKDKFIKYKVIDDKLKDKLESKIINIDFTSCEAISDEDLHNPFFRILLGNIIKKVYDIEESPFHEIQYFEKEDTMCVFKYKVEVERFNKYSAESMQSFLGMLFDEIDLVKIIEKRLKEEIDINSFTEEELRYFYIDGYKKIALRIASEEIMNNLPDLVTSNVDNEAIVGMIQYFYRSNFEKINSSVLDMFKRMLDNELLKKYKKDPAVAHKINHTVVQTLIKQTSTDIVKNSKLAEKNGKYIFDEKILPIFKVIPQNSVLRKEFYHDLMDKENYVRDLILASAPEKGVDIIYEHSTAIMQTPMDKGLAKSFVYNSIFNTGYGSHGFEILKNLFKFLVENYKLGSSSRLMEGVMHFLNHYSGEFNTEGFKYTKVNFTRRHESIRFHNYFLDEYKDTNFEENFLNNFDKTFSVTGNIFIKDEEEYERVMSSTSWIKTHIVGHKELDRGIYKVPEFNYRIYLLMIDFSKVLMKGAINKK